MSRSVLRSSYEHCKSTLYSFVQYASRLRYATKHPLNALKDTGSQRLGLHLTDMSLNHRRMWWLYARISNVSQCISSTRVHVVNPFIHYCDHMVESQILYKKASDSTKIGRFSPVTPYIRSVPLFKNRTVYTQPRRPYRNACMLELWTYHQRPKHVIKWVFSDVDICFFTNVVCLNAYDIYGVKVVYNAQFFTRIPNP